MRKVTPPHQLQGLPKHAPEKADGIFPCPICMHGQIAIGLCVLDLKVGEAPWTVESQAVHVAILGFVGYIVHLAHMS